MAKVITLSRNFLKGHPKAGQPTHFVEKVLKALGFIHSETDVRVWESVSPKIHTIRSGKRWKTGDMCSLKAWSDKPYNSPQIAIAPDFALPRVADIEIDWSGEIEIDGKFCSHVFELAENDGLTERDWSNWVGNNFSGQILFFTDTKTPY